MGEDENGFPQYVPPLDHPINLGVGRMDIKRGIESPDGRSTCHLDIEKPSSSWLYDVRTSFVRSPTLVKLRGYFLGWAGLLTAVYFWQVRANCRLTLDGRFLAQLYPKKASINGDCGVGCNKEGSMLYRSSSTCPSLSLPFRVHITYVGKIGVAEEG